MTGLAFCADLRPYLAKLGTPGAAATATSACIATIQVTASLHHDGTV